jgi:tetratricopeptide (TPR) repeat protein
MQTGERLTILGGYGQGGFQIRTGNPEAQAFFSNGMQLAHAFAHKAAVSAMQESRRLDPNCAMCSWGEAYAAGPTINYSIDDAERKRLAEVTANAERLATDGPEKEHRLIAAMKLRYAGDAKQGNKGFAEAMDALARAYPDDDSIAVVASDALLIASDAKPDQMARPVALLETVLQRNPDYAPAIHFYIHATEIAGFPKRAEPYANRLARIAPAASHLVHMPSHTYYWVGRYEDAAAANLKAVELGFANARRLKLPEPDGVWTLAYHGHNVQFGIGGALMAGDAERGLAIARPLVAMGARAQKLDPYKQAVLGQGYIAIARFAPLAETLAIAAPAKDAAIGQALWHYARGEAYARVGDRTGLEAEARAMPKKIKPDPLGGSATAAITVARLVLEGRMAMLDNRPDKAAKAFARAAALEEAKPLAEWTDPPLWWYPVRRDLAAALLAQGKTREALAEIEASLRHRPLDPVALATRSQIQAKLGNASAAKGDRAVALAHWHGTAVTLG